VTRVKYQLTTFIGPYAILPNPQTFAQNPLENIQSVQYITNH